MKKSKLAAVLALVASVSMALCACGGGSNTTSESAGTTSSDSSTAEESSESAVEAIKAAGKIVMVTNAEWEPFEYKEGNDFAGVDIEISQYIADQLGVELEIQDIAFDSCVPSVTEGRADFCAAALTVTEDRLKSVDFTDTYYNAVQALIVPAGSDIKTIADLEGKIVGVQGGTTGDILVTNEDGSNEFNVGEVKRFPKGMDAVSDLISGRIDAVVVDNSPAKKYVENNEGKIEIAADNFSDEEKYAIAVAKGSDLKDAINDILKDMVNSGEFDKIVSKYM